MKKVQLDQDRKTLGKHKMKTFRRFSTLPARCFLPKNVVESRVIDVIKSLRLKPENVPGNAHFVATLQFDTLQRKELLFKLGDEFCVEIPASKLGTINCVPSAVEYFSTHSKAR